MKILVTGCAGFIGSHLVDSLIADGHSVVGVDDLSFGKAENINPKCNFHNLDLLNVIEVEKIFKKENIDFVFHLAAAAKIGWCTEHPVDSHAINVTASLRLLHLSKMYAVKGFVFSSSSSVYGSMRYFQNSFTEDDRPAPMNFYAAQKLMVEHYCNLYSRFFNLPTVCLRYFNVYGTSRQSADGAYANVFSSFVRDMKEKGEITIHGDGEQVRDFVHVYDVVKANKWFLKTEDSKRFSGMIYNICSGKGTSINRIADHFKCSIKYVESRQGDPKVSIGNRYKIFSHHGFHASITLAEGIKILFDSYEK